MITKKVLLSELPNLDSLVGQASFAKDVLKYDAGKIGESTIRLKAMTSDIIHGVSGSASTFFSWFNSNIGMGVNSIKKFFNSMWASIGASNNAFMKVIHYIGSAIGTAINYVVKFLSPLVTQAKIAMKIYVPGLYGVTYGQFFMCVGIFASITFIIYKIYKKLKNRSLKEQSQPQTPQEIVKESKEMLRDTMEAVTEGVNTFKCCDKLVEGVNPSTTFKVFSNMVSKAKKPCIELYNGLFSSHNKSFNENLSTLTSSALNLLQNKNFIAIALLCISTVIGYIVSTKTNDPGWIYGGEINRLRYQNIQTQNMVRNNMQRQSRR